ncbi:MAG: hypothetical protein QNJ63_06770 [Calothrix sp. MO_192.B10]|nr:hypothetical protein [Calothrix sp. MO_192.B10]
MANQGYHPLWQQKGASQILRNISPTASIDTHARLFGDRRLT